MKLNILIFRNMKIMAFTTPNFTDLSPDVAATQLERSLILNGDDEAKLAPYKNLEMFHLGEFDDVTGKITLFEEPVHILSPREIVLGIISSQVEKAKEVQDANKNIN